MFAGLARYAVLPQLILVILGFCLSAQAFGQNISNDLAIRIVGYDSAGDLNSSGSGFLVAGEDLVLTNRHVIEESATLGIAVPTRSGNDFRIVDAFVVRSFDVDLAVIRAAEPLPFDRLVFSSAEPPKATPITAVGFPGAADVFADTGAELIEATVSVGAISRVLGASIQHDASLNSGNSGGPLLDQCGYVLGINTLQATDAQGIFVAISSSVAINRLNEVEIFPSTTSFVCTGSFSDFFKGPNFILYLVAVLILASGLFFWRKHRRRAAVSATGNRFTVRKKKTGFDLTGFFGNRTNKAPTDKSSQTWGSGTVFFDDRETGIPAGNSFEQTELDDSTDVFVESGGEPTEFDPSLYDRHGTVRIKYLGDEIYSSDLGRFPADGIGIGRDNKSNEVIVSGDSVSRKHARLTMDGYGPDAKIEIIDLNSANGTRINGRSISGATTLGETNSILVGDETIEILISFPKVSQPPKQPISDRPNSISQIHRLHAGDEIRDGRFSNTELYENRAWLLSGINDDGEVISYELYGDQFREVRISIGRENCDFVIPNSSVSKRHACIIIEPNLPPSIIDLQSTNGTRVDGTEIGNQPFSLYNSRNIELGTLTLELSVL